jgi:uridine kinase
VEPPDTSTLRGGLLAYGENMVPQRPFFLGVAGGSGSGKTTVADRLATMLGADHMALIPLDAYYVARSDQTIEQRSQANYDHPSAFDWELLETHLALLGGGQPAPVPIYDYAVHDRSSHVDMVAPRSIVVLEGILVLSEARIRDRLDLKVFVDIDADLRFIRRLERDVAERARSPHSVIEQYLTTVRPSHVQFVEPSKRYADVIVPHGGRNDAAIELLVARLRELVTDL